MAISPPEHISTAHSAESTGDKTVEVEVKTGDLIVAVGTVESLKESVALELSGGELTWTKQVDEADLEGETETDKIAGLAIWTAEAEAGKVAVKLHATKTLRLVLVVEVWRKHGGVGAKKGALNHKETTAPTLSLTTEQEHSALTAFTVDWNASTTTPAAWSGAETRTVDFPETGQSVYGAYYADVEAAGSKTVTCESPTQRYRLGVIEIKGLAPETPQVARPVADITTTGWTTTPLWEKLSDASDATIVEATPS